VQSYQPLHPSSKPAPLTPSPGQKLTLQQVHNHKADYSRLCLKHDKTQLQFSRLSFSLSLSLSLAFFLDFRRMRKLLVLDKTEQRQVESQVAAESKRSMCRD
jgi:hypothetical protein